MGHRCTPMSAKAVLCIFISVFIGAPSVANDNSLPTADGYRGIWYRNPAKGEIKYSGGMATYPQQIRPFAIYRKEVNKTFFTYGGTDETNSTLLHMVSYYDHATGTVPRPRIVMDKKTRDAHDNPCIAIDTAGHIWIFSNTHGAPPRSYIHRSTEPYSIERFEQIAQTTFSYSSPWYVDGLGFMLVHNRYMDGRAVALQTSTPDGRTWNEPRLLAQMVRGHYEISTQRGKRIAVAFNYHPRGLDTRTNLYYIESSDFGATWTTADGQKLDVPLKEAASPALAYDAEAEKRLVYLKDIQFDADQHPVLLVVTSEYHMPDGKPRQWLIAHWSGTQWKLKPVTTSDHNYDFGQLYIEDQTTWRLIAPTDPGAQPNMTGGDIVMWLGQDQGTTWSRHKTLTRDTKRNHNFVRQPIDAQDDFYALWADGDAGELSESNLYFTNKSGDAVWRLPARMDSDIVRPEPIAQAKGD
jgi:hypothetical protein